jgi:hypothetical protein
LQPLHPLDQIRLGRLDKKVVMVIHQYPSMHLPACLSTRISHTLQKKSPILFIQKNRRSPIPPSHHMVKSPVKFQSNTSRHVANPSNGRRRRNLKMKANEP